MSPPKTKRRAWRLKNWAAHTGVSIRTVYNWRQRHGLRVTEVAGIPLIFDEDGEAFLAKYRSPEAE